MTSLAWKNIGDEEELTVLLGVVDRGCCFPAATRLATEPGALREGKESKLALDRRVAGETSPGTEAKESLRVILGVGLEMLEREDIEDCWPAGDIG